RADTDGPRTDKSAQVGVDSVTKHNRDTLRDPFALRVPAGKRDTGRLTSYARLYMHLSRRGFLAPAGQSFALAGTGLLAACQSGPPPSTITVTVSPTSGPTTKPAIQPVASVGPATAAPAAASPAASPAAPSASPAVAAAASPSPVQQPLAAGAIAGKPQ